MPRKAHSVFVFTEQAVVASGGDSSRRSQYGGIPLSGVRVPLMDDESPEDAAKREVPTPPGVTIYIVDDTKVTGYEPVTSLKELDDARLPEE